MHEAITSKADFVNFVRSLKESFKEDPYSWQNDTLESFLGALEGFADDIDGYYLNRGENLPEKPTWRMFAEILDAARIYD